MGYAPLPPPPLASSVQFCDDNLPPNSIYRYLYQHGATLFPNAAFADLFKPLGRDSIHPRIVAVVMVLQRLEGLSDRGAVDQFAYNIRWKYAAGGLAFDHPGFGHTVLVRMRKRLQDSKNPRRIFDIVLEVAKSCGLVGRKRVLDSTPIYDAVATQDTVTLLRSAIRSVLQAADSALEVQLRQVLKRDDDYVKPGKPDCDWTDREARESLVDALCKDAHALLEKFNARQLDESVANAVKLLATIVDQDTQIDDDGTFFIVRKVARNRTISTVDPEARHGHKSTSRKYDGYKGHISIDPDSEIITATDVTPANVGDASVAASLVQDVLDSNSDNDEEAARSGVPESGEERRICVETEQSLHASETDCAADNQTKCENKAGDQVITGPQSEQDSVALQALSVAGSDENSLAVSADNDAPSAQERVEIYGDASYGEATFLERCKLAGADTYLKVQPPSAPAGKYSKDEFIIDLERNTVTCPNQQLVQLRLRADGTGLAAFGDLCRKCPNRNDCTSSKHGRTVSTHAKEKLLQEERRKQRDDAQWRHKYKATRPKVERKFGHLKRHYHGGRRARVRGSERVGHDFSMLAAAVNLQRLANLGAHPLAAQFN